MINDTWLKEYCKLNYMSRVQYYEWLGTLPIARAMVTGRLFNGTTSDRNFS
jgi:hypothetical protein